METTAAAIATARHALHFYAATAHLPEPHRKSAAAVEAVLESLLRDAREAQAEADRLRAMLAGVLVTLEAVNESLDDAHSFAEASVSYEDDPEQTERIDGWQEAGQTVPDTDNMKRAEDACGPLLALARAFGPGSHVTEQSPSSYTAHDPAGLPVGVGCSPRQAVADALESARGAR